MFEHLSRYFITDSKCTYIYQMKIELAINIPPTTAPNDEKANSGQIIYRKLFSRNILESVFAELTTKCQIFFAHKSTRNASSAQLLYFVQCLRCQENHRHGHGVQVKAVLVGVNKERNQDAITAFDSKTAKYSATNVGKVAILTKVNTKSVITAVRV